MDYRKKFYENYFKNQAGSLVGDLKSQYEIDKRQLQADLADKLPSDKSLPILELASGYGSLLLLLQEWGYQNVHGVDLSADQIKKAAELGARVEEADLFEYLKNDSGAYSAIISFDLIEHLTKAELLEFLDLVQQRLLPSGIALFRTCNVDAPFGSIYAYGDFTHETLLNKGSALQLMKSAGFSEVSVDPSPITYPSTIKAPFQRLTWFMRNINMRSTLFASGRSARKVLFTPNMIIRGLKA